MSFALGTDEALDDLRAAIGTSVTVGSHTFTWQHMIEGPLLRCLEDLDQDYPSIVIEVADTDAAMQGGAKWRMELPVTVWVILPTGAASATGVSARIYQMTRKVGEAVLSAIMDAGPKLDGSVVSDRQLGRFGVDYATTHDLADHNLCLYHIDLTLVYYQDEVRG